MSAFAGAGAQSRPFSEADISAAGDVRYARLGVANTIAGVQTFSDATEATSVSAAAMKIAGGLGIAKKLFVGGNASIAGALAVTGNSNLGDIYAIRDTNTGALFLGSSQTTVIYNNGTLLSLIGNPVSIASAAASTSSSNGALTVTGGLGVGGALNVGGTLGVTGAATLSSSLSVGTTLTAANTITSTGGNASVTVEDRVTGSTDAWTMYANSGILRFFKGGDQVSITGAGKINAVTQQLSGTTASTTPGTGSFTTGGGIGALGAINAGTHMSVPANGAYYLNGYGGNCYLAYNGSSIILVKGGSTVATW